MSCDQVVVITVNLPPPNGPAPKFKERLLRSRLRLYDTSGQRREPVWRLLPLSDESTALPLGSDDVLLVTGGGKGITAECALSLARETGTRLALFGRYLEALLDGTAQNLTDVRAA